MTVPSDAMRQEPLANIVQMHTDLGKPRVGRFAERHPADEEYGPITILIIKHRFESRKNDARDGYETPRAIS